MTELWEVAIVRLNNGIGLACYLFSKKEDAEQFLAEARKLWTNASLTKLVVDEYVGWRTMARHWVARDKVTGGYLEWEDVVMAPPDTEAAAAVVGDNPHGRTAVSYISHADARALLESGAGSAVDGEAADGGNP